MNHPPLPGLLDEDLLLLPVAPPLEVKYHLTQTQTTWQSDVIARRYLNCCKKKTLSNHLQKMTVEAEYSTSIQKFKTTWTISNLECRLKLDKWYHYNKSSGAQVKLVTLSLGGTLNL